MAKTFLVVLRLLLKNNQLHYVIGLVIVVMVALLLLQPARLEKPPITKWEAIDYLSATTLSMFLLSLLLTGSERALAIEKVAERDLLLTQPVSLTTYFLAKDFYSSIAVASNFYLGASFSLFIYGANAKNVLLFPLIMLVELLFSSMLGILRLLVLAGRLSLSLLRASASVYLVAALLHSAGTRALSPLLTAPLRWVVRPLVFSLTLTEPWQQVLAESLPLAAMCVVLVPSYAKLAGRIVHPEEMKHFTEVMTESEGDAEPELSFLSDPRSAIFELYLWRPFTSKTHMTRFVAGTAILAVVGLLLRFFGVVEVIEVLVIFEYPFLVLMIAVMLAAAVAFDLGPLWFLRVNLADFKALVAAETLKYTVYLSEVLVAITAFVVALTGRLDYLLLPLASLPLISGISVSSLLAIAIIISKKKLVRYSSEGFTEPENWLFGIFLALTVPLLLVVELFVFLIEERVAWLPLYLVVAIVVSFVILLAGVNIVADQLYSRDVAS